MARLKKCTEKDISVLLETSSDSNIEELDESYVPKKSTDNGRVQVGKAADLLAERLNMIGSYL